MSTWLIFKTSVKDLQGNNTGEYYVLFFIGV